ncbi:MAG: FtsK/SpoIIIE domain-containing protein [Lachnospiraceae bacterium]|nr:FtsK/SpoIIIE domain-containing protein [Lachnospiraceae bacterium]
MLQEKNNKKFSFYIGLLLVMLGLQGAVTLFARLIPEIPYIKKIQTYLLIGSIAIILGYIVFWCISHHINKGIRYAMAHAKMVRSIRNALIDAEYGYTKQYFNGEPVIVLPKIKVEFEPDLTQGTVYIQNNFRIQNKLEDRNISSALGKYVVEQQYRTDDENWNVWEFVDSKANNQLVFHSYEEFVSYSKGIGDYKLFMDKKNIVPLSSLLLTGTTGSGKTYALYGLVFQCLNWNIKPKFYFADPKASSLSVFGKRIAPERTAESVEDIIRLLEEFCAQMELRKKEIQDKLEQKLDSDYRDFKLPAYIFVIDEFASFQSSVNTMDKQTRDKVAMMLRVLVLQSRQLGFAMWYVSQKSDGTDLPTNIRDNLIWKCVLGQAPRTTYQTTFEETADLPKRKFRPGEGLYTYQGLTRQAQIVSFPTLQFDINEAVKLYDTGTPVL